MKNLNTVRIALIAAAFVATSAHAAFAQQGPAPQGPARPAAAPATPAAAPAAAQLVIPNTFAANVQEALRVKQAACIAKGPTHVWRTNDKFGVVKPDGKMSTSIGTCRARSVTASELASAGIDAATIQRVMSADRAPRTRN